MLVHIVHKFVLHHRLLNDILFIDIQILNVFNVPIVHFRNSLEFVLIISVFLFLDRFKCADSLTVHRRRLHLLPLIDKNNDEDEKQEASNSNDKQDVIKKERKNIE